MCGVCTRSEKYENKRKESLICLLMNDQEIPLVMEMVEFLIKVLHFCKSIQSFERNCM